MISASHNPFRDNGLKAFGGDGMKLSDELELRIEARLLDGAIADPGDGTGAPPLDPELARHYVEALEAAVPDHDRLRGLSLCLDCANGAASALAPEVFRYFGATVTVIGAEPDGRNINLDCGSLHLERLGRLVREGGHDLGLAFDGDADRCLAVDRRGRVVDGDFILYITGRRLQQAGRLRGNGIVATIMSNFWLEAALADDGIRLLRAPVGDKYVLERMLGERLSLGGEQSGHVIFLDHATTGDGMLTGLLLLDALAAGAERLEAILDRIEPCPQLLLNVRVTAKPDLREHPTIGPAVAEAERALEGSGRVVLRYSGTESLARVMVEGRDLAAVRRHAERIASLIEAEIGER
jgi:phosphoglucosamine mutase